MLKRKITLVFEIDFTDEQCEKWPHSFYAIDTMSNDALRNISFNRAKILLKKDEPQ